MRISSWAAALVVAVAAPALAGHEGKLTWETDPQKGLAKAKAAGLPGMLFFTAEW